MSIYVIDEIMGRGKTSAMINYINESPPDARFLFITPLLSETDRIARNCSGRNFYQPEAEGGKLNHIKEAFAEHKNIASTHALFGMLDNEAIELIRKAHYTLVIDEVPCTISITDITYYDANNIVKNYADVGEKGRLVWTCDEYTGKYDIYKEAVQRGNIYRYSDMTWVSLMPLELFLSFDDVYIMTYMFEHQIQRCYFDLHDIPYKRKYVAGTSPSTYSLADSPSPIPRLPYKDLIHICDNRKLNKIGESTSALSKNWHVTNVRDTSSPLGKRLRMNAYNYVRNVHAAKAADVLWTTFKKDDRYGFDWQKLVASKGYASGFLSCNAKGTNDYRNRHTLLYLVNRYPNTCIRNFLSAHGIEFDQNMFALSEMLQWIWRSAIRDGEEIWIYIPSRRMRELLEKWLEEVSTDRSSEES